MVWKFFKRLKWLLVAVLIATLVALAVGATGVYQYMTRDSNPIPQQMRSKLTFSPFVIPTDTKNISTSNYKFDKVEDGTEIFSYLISLKSYNVTISEYTQPSQFTDIPEYKNQFLSEVIKQYGTVQTSNGTIYLGRAAKQNNKQLAIMIESGLIVFLNPDKELTNAQWRSIGDQLEIQKITD